MATATNPNKETILDNSDFVLWYYPESKIIHHQIKRYIFGEKLRELLDKGYELLKEKDAQKWLSDDRNNDALSNEDGNWTNNDWLPRVASAGWKYWALVMPKGLIGQMNMKKHAEFCAKVGVTVKVFSDPDEALQWLNEL
jgi:hypothetical protein